MSQDSEREFSFTWRVENFSMCPMQEDERLESPIFIVDMCKKRKLQLHLYPRGWKSSEWISCFVVSTELAGSTELLQNEELDKTSIGYAFTIAGSYVSSKKTMECKCRLKNRVWGIVKLAQRSKLMKKKQGFLPNDTLTIQYRMWIIDEKTKSTEFSPADVYLGKEGVLPAEILMSAARHELEELKRHFSSTQCSAETRFRVGRKSLVWPIKRVNALRSGQRLTLSVTPGLVDDPAFGLTFYLTGESADRSAHLEIRRKESDYDKYIFVTCQITVLSSMKDVKLCMEGEHFFKSKIEDDVWNFPFSNHKSELQKFLDSTNVLYLRCELAYSRQGGEYHTENNDVVPLRIAITPDTDPSTTPGNDFKDISKTCMVSDVTLRVGVRSFTAHKTVLSNRSPVFRAMFENMKGKVTGLVDITDLDADTLYRMLFFLYCGQLDNLVPEDAVKLYSAADKYRVLFLRWTCSLYLQSVLSASNVCLILNLADLHQDDILLDVAKEFVFRNANEVFASGEWSTFMEMNAKLSASVMHQVLTR